MRLVATQIIRCDEKQLECIRDDCSRAHELLRTSSFRTETMMRTLYFLSSGS